MSTIIAKNPALYWIIRDNGYAVSDLCRHSVNGSCEGYFENIPQVPLVQMFTKYNISTLLLSLYQIFIVASNTFTALRNKAMLKLLRLFFACTCGFSWFTTCVAWFLDSAQFIMQHPDVPKMLCWRERYISKQTEAERSRLSGGGRR